MSFLLLASGGAQFYQGDLLFYLHLPILILVMSLVYSATRYDDWGLILQESLRWIIRMTVFLVVVGLVVLALRWIL